MVTTVGPVGRLATVSVGEDGAVLEVCWVGGRHARFHALWLRDNSLDPSTRGPANGQRLITIGVLDPATRVATAEIGDDGTAVTVRFEPEGLTTEFEASWLEANRYDRPRRRDWGWTAAGVERWDGASMDGRLARAGYSQVCADPLALARWLAAIERAGVAILHGVPVRSGVVCEVAALFGHVRETNYGRWFDVRARVNPDNLADTNLGLQAHTDNPYRDPVPTLQLLHCLDNSVEGGDSSVVDGFMAVARLHAEDPDAARLLADHPARFEYHGSADVWLRAKRPIIEIGPDGELLGVRFNNRSAAPWTDVPFDDMPAFLTAYRRLAEIIDDPAMQVRFRLAPGDLFVVDNRRVLHSRTAFGGEGARWLQGCYADVDGLASTVRVHRSTALADTVADTFARRGAEEYLGEAVSMAEHMAQCAAQAEAAGADDELVIAALLHDLGHFTSDLGTYSAGATVDHRHEIAGAAALAGLVPRRVTDCIRLHVAAKRYLCAVEPQYRARLSPASVHTLALQGGPMNTAEITAFESEPHHADAVRLRRWDEAAKDPTVTAPPLAHYLALLHHL